MATNSTDTIYSGPVPDPIEAWGLRIVPQWTPSGVGGFLVNVRNLQIGLNPESYAYYHCPTVWVGPYLFPHVYDELADVATDRYAEWPLCEALLSGDNEVIGRIAQGYGKPLVRTGHPGQHLLLVDNEVRA